jgi:2-polyprenyl-3-methyl-5-hydroxy-6-metoxy-1,4-benzoquinol methylase
MVERENLRTDADWETFARADPYWAVLTHDQFRRENLNPGTRAEFFESGEGHIQKVFDDVRRHLIAEFAPRRALDFGCGVGRLLIPLARRCAEVVGVDVSETMLHEAADNCRAENLGHVTLVKGDDDLSAVTGTFDLVNTFLVLQHVPVARGVRIFQRLVELIAPGGCGALHATYADARPRPPEPLPPRRGVLRRVTAPVLRPVRAALRPVFGWGTTPSGTARPEMQMNPYPLDVLLRTIQDAGAEFLRAKLMNHGGWYAVQLLFRKERSAA